jgi:hypothetical protein
MRILLTDGSGLTARQVAGRLAGRGHTVDALAPDPFCLCRFTRHVGRIRPVPPFGAGPMAWLDAALEAYVEGGFDVLFPTHEQVALLAAVPDPLRRAGVVTAVPTFDALASVQDKASALRTLDALGIPQPPGAVGCRGWHRFPAFVKEPIGTASARVRRVDSVDDLTPVERESADLVVQAAVEGPLAMCQSVFDHGSMVAFHANLRVGEGANGGASRKCSIELPEARSWMEVLGSGLAWHGALSADVIVTATGVVFIDVNPRLVEPNNAWCAGVDLVGAVLDVATGHPPGLQGPDLPGVATHQLLLAVLGAAQHTRGRRAVAKELMDGWRHRGSYAGSLEELTPIRGDPRAAIPLALAAAATLVRPASWEWFVSASVQNYSLTASAWDEIGRVAARS